MGSGKIYTLEEIKNALQEYGFEYVGEYVKSDKPMVIKDKEGYFYTTTYQTIKKINLLVNFHPKINIQ